MINKGLLSEVLASPTKVDYYGLSLFGYGNRNLMFKWKSSIDGTEVEDSINIYELAYKCKEWAFDKGYTLTSGNNHLIFMSCSIRRTLSDDDWTDFYADTEPEAIFNACQWILNKKDSLDDK